MKNIKKYFGLTLIALLFSVVFSACEDKNEVGSENIGLGIKVFSPTKVVTGQPVTINGSGLADVKEVVFPGGIVVTNIDKVSNEMIRVITPAGINIPAEGEKLIVRTADAEAVSPRVMTQGNTVPRSYFPAEEGADVKQKSIVTIYGQDMEFVNKVVFENEDGTPIELGPKDFYRIAATKIDIKIPADMKLGNEGKYYYYTYDGKSFELPTYNYVAGGGGHWETVKTLIWENPDPAGNGAVNWNGTYRFANSENLTGEEIAEITMDNWAIIRNKEFKIDVEGASPQIRVTTGWWSTTWTGEDIMPGNERMVDNGNGTWTLTINFEGDPILDALDQQHLLFTGGGFTPLRIYSEEEVWVEGGEEGHEEKVSIWKNDGSVGEANWNGTYRFANSEHLTGEEIAEITMDNWDIIKTQTFYVEIEGANPQVRVTTGWWSTTWTGNDIQPGNELLEEKGDNKWILTINFEGDPILDVLDEQHLLFTGSGYKVNEIYTTKWVEGGDAPKEVVVWENTDPDGNGAVSWNGTYRFANSDNLTGEEIAEIPLDQWEVLRTKTFYVDVIGDNPQIRVTTGWWSTTWTGNDIQPGNDALIENGDGSWTLVVNFEGDPILDLLDQQHLLFTGGGFTPMKIYYK